MPDRLALLNVNINGIEHVDALLAAGRTEDARSLMIACARACWLSRWATRRERSLRRLGDALDTGRHPQLTDIAAALRAEAPEAAGAFLDYMRQRPSPDLSRFINPPPSAEAYAKAAAPSGGRPRRHNCHTLWADATASGDPELRAALDQRLAIILDPVRVPSWHETNYAWVRLVSSALHHGGIDDHTLCMLYLFALDYAEHANAFSHSAEPTQPSVGGNHYLHHIISWFTMSLVVPEFSRMPALRRGAVVRMDDELDRQVMPDGSMVEGAPGYQNCCLHLLGEYLRLAQEHDVDVPESTYQRTAEMAAHCLGLLKPDGRTPMFGDSQDDGFRHLAARVEPFIPSPELAWAVSQGERGTPPKFTSAAFECIGYYAMRTGWDRDALCMVFDGGRFGDAHHHEDKLSFELQAYGRELLVDPGVYGYDKHWFREWSILSAAHNTIVVAGVSQCRWRQDRALWSGRQPVDTRWQTGDAWDEVEASFDGPWERDLGSLCVRRRVRFYKGTGDTDGPPAFWWITDHVDGEGRHDIAQYFHFSREVGALSIDRTRAWTADAGVANLAVVLATSDDGDVDGITLTKHRGEENPYRGWVSPTIGHLEPAWEVCFTGAAALPARRDFILIPSPGAFAEPPDATVQDDATVTLRTGNHEWQITRPNP